MKEVIILEVNGSKKSHLIQDFLKQKNIDYRILTETQLELNDNLKEKEQLKKRLITAYQRQAKNKKLQAELGVWEKNSIHVLMMDAAGYAIAAGRLQLNGDDEGQIRSMAVRGDLQGKGLGSVIMQYIEQKAKSKKLKHCSSLLSD